MPLNRVAHLPDLLLTLDLPVTTECSSANRSSSSLRKVSAKSSSLSRPRRHTRRWHSSPWVQRTASRLPHVQTHGKWRADAAKLPVAAATPSVYGHIGQKACSANAVEMLARALQLEERAARMEARAAQLTLKARAPPLCGWAPTRARRDLDELTERAGLMLIAPSPPS